MIEEYPDHSAWYIERFRVMAAERRDLDGEARLVDAMVQCAARILDAGCGPGRVRGRLAALGHHVVGVDIDADLIAALRADHSVDLARRDIGRSLNRLSRMSQEGFESPGSASTSAVGCNRRATSTPPRASAPQNATFEPVPMVWMLPSGART